MEHELPEVLDGFDEPATVEELEGVVRRAGQRRRASIIAGAAGLLVVGAFGGAVARGPGEGGSGFAGSRDEPEPAPAVYPDVMGPTSGPMFGGGQSLKPLFRREANGVAIRGYRASWTTPEGLGGPKCGPPEAINGELSNGAAVTFAMAPLFPTTDTPAGPQVTVLSLIHI